MPFLAKHFFHIYFLTSNAQPLLACKAGASIHQLLATALPRVVQFSARVIVFVFPNQCRTVLSQFWNVSPDFNLRPSYWYTKLIDFDGKRTEQQFNSSFYHNLYVSNGIDQIFMFITRDFRRFSKFIRPNIQLQSCPKVLRRRTANFKSYSFRVASEGCLKFVKIPLRFSTGNLV